MTTLIVSVPDSLNRYDFVNTWRNREFTSKGDFNKAWDEYQEDCFKKYELTLSEKYAFDVYSTTELCTRLNNDMCPSEVRYFAPVHIG